MCTFCMCIYATNCLLRTELLLLIMQYIVLAVSFRRMKQNHLN